MQNVGLLTRGGHQGVGLLEAVADPIAPAITTTALPNGRVSQTYSQTIQATGHPVPTITVTDGELPLGLSLDSALRRISGVPMEPTLAAFTLTATNSAGSDSKALSILVPNEGYGGALPVVTTITLVPDEIDVYPDQTTELTISVEDQNGDPIPNVVAVAEVNNEDVTVEQLVPTDATGLATVSVTGASVGGSIVAMTLDGVESNTAAVTVLDAISVTAVSVSPKTASIDTTATVQFSALVTGTGTFSPDVTWSVISGGGTVSAGGLYTPPATAALAVVRATSVTDPTKYGDAAVDVSAVPIAPTITTSTLPPGRVGDTYTQVFEATGTAPIAWAIVAGTLPPELELSGATLAGEPSMEGSYTFTVRAENAAGFNDRVFNITVHAADVEPPTNEPPTDIVLSASEVLSDTAVGAAVGSLTVVDPDQVGGHTLELVGDAGGLFRLDGNTLVVNGPLLGHRVTVRATDASGAWIEKTFAVALTPVLIDEYGGRIIYRQQTGPIVIR